jgi:hypothetical protein
MSGRNPEKATLIRGIGGVGVALIALNSMIGAGKFVDTPHNFRPVSRRPADY